MGRPRKPWNELTKQGMYTRLNRERVKTNVCAGCGAIGATDWHHVDDEDYGEDAEIEELCRSCHNRKRASNLTDAEIAQICVEYGRLTDNGARQAPSGTVAPLAKRFGIDPRYPNQLWHAWKRHGSRPRREYV